MKIVVILKTAQLLLGKAHRLPAPKKTANVNVVPYLLTELAIRSKLLMLLLNDSL